MKDFMPAQSVPTIYVDPQSNIHTVDQILNQRPTLEGRIDKFDLGAVTDGLLDPFAAFEDVRN